MVKMIVIVRLIVVGTLAAVAVGQAAYAASSGHTFQLIADTSNLEFTQFINPGRLNNFGQVAFSVRLSTGDTAIYSGDENGLAKIADTSGQFTFVSQPSINDLGVVAFSVEQDLTGDKGGIFIGDGNTVTSLIENTPETPLFGIAGGEVFINNSGKVLFVANVFLNAFDQSVIVTDGTNHDIIIDESSGFSNFVQAFINDNNTVSFHGFERITGSPRVLFLNDQSGLMQVEDDTGNIKFFGSSSHNNSDKIAFSPTFDDDSRGVATNESGVTTIIADESGSFIDFTTIGINDSSQLAYFACLQGGLCGIFLGPNPNTDALILAGDPLFGSVVDQIEFGGPDAINNQGQIVFTGTLQDGRQFVARADPVPVSLIISPPIWQVCNYTRI